MKRNRDVLPVAVSMEVLATVRFTPDMSDRIKEFVKPMEARRLGKLQKAALITSLSALREANLECPDAIVVGTSYGMLENSEKFLMQLCRDGEQELSPTQFYAKHAQYDCRYLGHSYPLPWI